MSYGNSGVTIDYTFHAVARGIGGIEVGKVTSGSARDASREMIDWLESLDTSLDIANAQPSVEIWCKRRSAQILTGVHDSRDFVTGLPAVNVVEYAVDAVRGMAKADTWGRGGP